MVDPKQLHHLRRPTCIKTHVNNFEIGNPCLLRDLDSGSERKVTGKVGRTTSPTYLWPKTAELCSHRSNPNGSLWCHVCPYAVGYFRGTDAFADNANVSGLKIARFFHLLFASLIPTPLSGNHMDSRKAPFQMSDFYIIIANLNGKMSHRETINHGIMQGGEMWSDFWYGDDDDDNSFTTERAVQRIDFRLPNQLQLS